MHSFVPIGFNNHVSVDEVEIIFAADAEKLRRFLKKMGVEKNTDMFCDATDGKPVKSCILLKSGRIIASALGSDTFAKRFNNQNKEIEINE